LHRKEGDKTMPGYRTLKAAFVRGGVYRKEQVISTLLVRGRDGGSENIAKRGGGGGVRCEQGDQREIGNLGKGGA